MDVKGYKLLFSKREQELGFPPEAPIDEAERMRDRVLALLPAAELAELQAKNEMLCFNREQARADVDDGGLAYAQKVSEGMSPRNMTLSVMLVGLQRVLNPDENVEVDVTTSSVR
jgi:hypothetical protein